MALFNQKYFDIILYFDINWQPTNYNQVSSAHDFCLHQIWPPVRDEISDHWWSFHRPLQGNGQHTLSHLFLLSNPNQDSPQNHKLQSTSTLTFCAFYFPRFGHFVVDVLVDFHFDVCWCHCWHGTLAFRFGVFLCVFFHVFFASTHWSKSKPRQKGWIE